MACVVDHNLCRLLASPGAQPDAYPADPTNSAADLLEPEIQIVRIAPLIAASAVLGAWIWFMPWK